MNSTFLAIALIMVISRIPLYYHDSERSARWHYLKPLIEMLLFLLILGFSPQFFFLTLANFTVSALAYYWEKNTCPNIPVNYAARLIPFFSLLLLLAFMIPHRGIPQSIVTITEAMPQFMRHFAFYDLIPRMQWSHLLLILLGLLVCVVEANNLVRWLIQKLELKPQDSEVQGVKTYNRGRIIGIMERFIIYYSFLSARYELAAFVLTGKSIVRYRKMDEEDFAEYFLVGTLVSTVVAGTIAIVVRYAVH